MKKQATEEAKTLSESLRASRENKLAPRKRRRKNSHHGEDPMKAMARFFAIYPKNESSPHQPDRTSYHQDRRAPTNRDRYQGRGKEPEAGRDYPRKDQSNIRTKKKRHLRRHRHITCNTVHCNENFLQQTMNKTNDSEIIIHKSKNIFEKMSEYVGFSPPPTYFLHIRCDQ